MNRTWIGHGENMKDMTRKDGKYDNEDTKRTQRGHKEDTKRTQCIMQEIVNITANYMHLDNSSLLSIPLPSVSRDK